MNGELRECRACGAASLAPVLDLGLSPLANALIDPARAGEPEEVFPLRVAFCERCSLVQLTDTVPPERLFREYVYFSSFSDTMVKHAEDLVGRIVRERSLGPASSVIEAASNDGYLLRHYKSLGVQVLGVDPAENVAAVAERERGVPTLRRFFGAELGAELAAQGRRFDVMHAHNVFAHVPDIHGFARGVAEVLKPDGVAVIEAPYVRDLVERAEFDTIYHEHVYYFSLRAADALFRRHGLRVADVERVEIHGGTLRLWVERGDAPPRGAVERLAAEEVELGMHTRGYYEALAARVTDLRASLGGLLRELRAQGRSVAAYGASAKGTTLMHACGVGRAELDFVVDRSTRKQGLLTPGTRLEIAPPERLLTAMPDYVLLLTWNFADEIMAQQAEYRRRGGRFIVPVPSVRVV